MNRREFLGIFFGLAVAPAVAAGALVSPLTPKYKVYNGRDAYIPMETVTIPLESKVRKLKGGWTYEP